MISTQPSGESRSVGALVEVMEQRLNNLESTLSILLDNIDGPTPVAPGSDKPPSPNAIRMRADNCVAILVRVENLANRISSIVMG